MKPGLNDSTIVKKHHAVGLISTGLAIVTGFLSLALFIVSMIPKSGTYTAERFMNIFLIFAFCIAPALYLCGLGLAIAGMFIKSSKKLFPVIGLILNAVPFLAVLAVWIFLFWVLWAVIASGGGWH